MEFCYNVEECNNLSVHMFLTQFSGFNFEVELDEEYFKIAKKRINKGEF